VARPWRKQWPYVSRSGKRSYQLGYRDHDGGDRTKSFATARHANTWRSDYMTAERRGPESLRRFLLDLDAQEANEREDRRTIAEVIQLYFAYNAPDTPDGLAPSTFRSYQHAARRHLLGAPGESRGRYLAPAPHGVRFAHRLASELNRPTAARSLREEMRLAGVGASARTHAWRVLSAALSWAAGSELVPEVETNGCLLANERISNRRKSMRATGTTRSTRRHGTEIRGWALSPLAVELIRREMLAGSGRHLLAILDQRDAMILTIQFGLALRNQEVHGLRWSSFPDGARAVISEVLSHDTLEAKAKTERATGRSVKVPALLVEDLARWRSELTTAGFETRPCDFVIPGDLLGRGHGVLERATGAVHATRNQAQKWGPRYLRPAARALAARDPASGELEAASPYSLRRGGISARLRGEDAQSVAHQCGTSLEMLSRHYSYEIDERWDGAPVTLEAQWRAARESVTGG
jgi:hypothetical protein